MKRHNIGKHRITPYMRLTNRVCLGFCALCVCVTALVLCFKLNVAAVRAGETHGAKPTQTATATPDIIVSPTHFTEPDNSPHSTSDYTPTSILIDGEVCVVLASYQAADELITGVKAHFAALVPPALNSTTEIANTIELVAAEHGAGTVGYDAAYALLTSDDTPLTVRTTIQFRSIEAIPFETDVRTDSTLYEGMRIVKVYGRAGLRISTLEQVYVNGKMASSDTLLNEVAIAPEKRVIHVGTKPIPSSPEPPSSQWGYSLCPSSSIAFAPPCSSEVVKYFGFYDGVMHYGIDFATQGGERITSSSAGVVVSLMERGMYGLVLEIDCGSGFIVRYAGLRSSAVAIGDSVALGDQIGVAGESNLHVEIIVNGAPVNPRYYLFGGTG